MPVASLLVRIYPLTDKDPFPVDVQPLRIDNKEIRIFRDVLMSQMRLQHNAAGWWLEFFMQSSHPRRFFVSFSRPEELARERQTRWPITRLAYTQLYSPSGMPNVATDAIELRAACKEASVLARESAAIQPEHVYEASTHHGYVDGRGTLYISKRNGMEQFERHVLLHALAYAYLLTMEELGNALSKLLPGEQREEDLRTLYKQVALFNAKSFFHQPVKLSNGATCEAWQRIDNALGIRDANTELFKQVQSAHYIYSLDDEKHAQQRATRDAVDRQVQERKEKRRDGWLALVGLMVALASVPGVMELVKG